MYIIQQAALTLTTQTTTLQSEDQSTYVIVSKSGIGKLIYCVEAFSQEATVPGTNMQYTYNINTYRNSVNNQFAIIGQCVVRAYCHLRTAAMAWTQTWDIPESLGHVGSCMDLS